MNKPKIPSITLKPVKSSQLSEIGHNGDTLAVRFKAGGPMYHYRQSHRPER